MMFSAPDRTARSRLGGRLGVAWRTVPVRPLAFLALLLCGPLAAQPVTFGSADDPFELGSGVRPRDAFAAWALAGPAYLPDTWRTAVAGDVEAARGRLSIAAGATVHPGAGGLYSPEADEAYDALRVLRYARINPTPSSSAYLRLGPTERQTLGTGALVRGYRTTTAWDERRLGVEAAVGTGRTRLGAFVDDVALGGVAGAEARVTTGLGVGPLRSLGLGVAAVHDLGLPDVAGDSSLTGVEVTVRGQWAVAGPLGVVPFVTHARYLGRGGTVGVGVDAGVDNAGDAARAQGRLAVFASSSQFVPGHVGPFYAISNLDERIVDDGAFFNASAENALVGTPIGSVRAGVDVVLDLRFLLFRRLEVAQHVRRHVGADAVSAYSFRAGARLGGGTRVAFGLERQGFRGFFDLIGSLGDQNTLVLDVGVPVGARTYAFVRSRYGYRRLTADDGDAYTEADPPRFLVERRFEPLAGVRVALP